MKKLLAIAPYPYLPYFSGGQKFIAKTFEYLGRRSDLTVIGTKENDWSLATTYKTIPLLKSSFSRYFDPALPGRISELIKKNEIDTVIWEHPYFAWLAYRVKKRTGARTVIHTHNIEYQRFRSTGRWWWPLLKIYEKWCFKKADHLLFITPGEKEFAIKNWNIPPEKCIDLPFGVDIQAFPTDRDTCRERIRSKHKIGSADKIIFFNGLLDYKPNLDALKVILDRINPVLLKQSAFHYKIIICGKRLPAELNELKAYADKNIIYGGFTEDIATYYKASDLFLNPVQTGGGIKTKMVESIAYGTTVIAAQSGAEGIQQEACGNKLFIVPDNDWDAFTRAIPAHINDSSVTPQAFYDLYYWENIISKLVKELSKYPAGKGENE